MPMIRFMIRPEPRVTVEHVVDHVDHLITLVGPEHVGVGSDPDGTIAKSYDLKVMEKKRQDARDGNRSRVY